MFCVKCGQEMEESVKFCPNCGTQVGAVEKPKKPVYTQWWFWVILALSAAVVFCIVIIGSGSEEDSHEIVPAATETAPAPFVPAETAVYVPEVTEAPAAAADNSQPSMDAVISVIEMTMKDAISHYDISYEDDIITINVWEDGIASASAIAATGNEEFLESWDELVESQKYCCTTIAELVETLGCEGVSVVLNVLNDLNKDKVLVSVMDGFVLYDSVR